MVLSAYTLPLTSIVARPARHWTVLFLGPGLIGDVALDRSDSGGAVDRTFRGRLYTRVQGLP